MYFSRLTGTSTKSSSRSAERLVAELDAADAVVVGAGAGLSTAAGFTYTGARFDRWFADFGAKYGFADMYSGGFYPYATLEEHWAYWSRYIWCNRYEQPSGAPLYRRLVELLRGRDYFVLTTNVDHQFQLAGIERHRLFYTQGDYGLFQCSKPCCQRTYDNKDQVRRMLEAQGYRIGASGRAELPAGTVPAMRIPNELVPRCPACGRPMSMNLRSDATFIEDEGWHAAAARYREFLRRHAGMRTLYLELGVGGNTPGIIKFPFWQMVAENPRATYACVNPGEAVAPVEISDRSILLDADAAQVIEVLATR